MKKKIIIFRLLAVMILIIKITACNKAPVTPGPDPNPDPSEVEISLKLLVNGPDGHYQSLFIVVYCEEELIDPGIPLEINTSKTVRLNGVLAAKMIGKSGVLDLIYSFSDSERGEPYNLNCTPNEIQLITFKEVTSMTYTLEYDE